MSLAGQAQEFDFCGARSGIWCSVGNGRAAWLHSGSRMSGDVDVRFCQRLGVRFPGPTQLVVGSKADGS
jgi:hypothetical protein